MVTEKEILELSLLLITVQRKCLNLLIQEGFMHYYPENTRSYVYRITDFRQLEEQLVSKVAQSVRNVHVLMEKESVSKEQLLKLECMLWDLDDILLIFID